MAPSLPPAAAGLWDKHRSCRGCGGRRKKGRAISSCCPGSLAEGAPGKEVGYTWSDSDVDSWRQECQSVGNRPSDGVGWGSGLGLQSKKGPKIRHRSRSWTKAENKRKDEIPERYWLVNRFQRRGAGEPRTRKSELNVRMWPGGAQVPFLLRSGVGRKESNRGWQRSRPGRACQRGKVRSRDWVDRKDK